jgi:hypothetical protein
MKLPKPTDDDRALVAILVPTGDKIQVKPMFGNLGAFVDGNMFMGLFGSDIGHQTSRRQRRGAPGD